MVACAVFFVMLGWGRAGYYTGFVIGFIITYFIAQMIAEKSFHIWHKARALRIFSGVAVGLYVLVLAITRGALWGYVTYVPAYDSVAEVHINHNFQWRGNEGHDFVFITDRQIIAQALHSHAHITADRRTLRNVVWQNQGRFWQRTDTVVLTYRLHNGREISRRYILWVDYMRDTGIEAMLREEAVILSRYPELLDPVRINIVNLFNLPGQNNEENRTLSISNNRVQIHTLTEAMRRDMVLSARRERQRQLGEVHWGNNNGDIGVEMLVLRFADDIHGNRITASGWRYLHLTETGHTMAWLRQEGFLE
jgi:hypothetical protein